MSDHSARLGLPYLAAAQAQKHVTHNEGLRRLDAYVHLKLESIRALSPPSLPQEGNCWFVPAGAEGVFAGHEGAIASWETGAFEFLPVPAGGLAFIRDEGRVMLFNGVGWVSPLAATAHHAAIEAHVAEEDVVLSGAYIETRISIPDRAIVLGVSTRTLSAVTGAASYDCGVADERTKFGGSLGVARGASNAGVVGPTAYYEPTPVRVSANGGAFTGGRVRVAIHYMMCPVAEVFPEEEAWWRQASYLLDGVPPSLAADLVRERYALADVHCSAQDILVRSGGPKWVVSAAGTLAEVPANTLAFDYVGGHRRMVLEGGATNLALQSATMASGWAGSRCTREGGQADPTGGTNASRWVQTDGSTTAYLEQSPFLSVAVGEIYTQSIFVRKETASGFALYGWEIPADNSGNVSHFATFAWTDGVPVISSQANILNAGVQEVGQGWFRVWVSYVIAKAGSHRNRYHPSTVNAVGAGTTFYLPQLEKGSAPTSPVLTTTTAVTRVADHAPLSAAAAATLGGTAATLAVRGTAATSLPGTYQPILTVNAGKRMLVQDASLNVWVYRPPVEAPPMLSGGIVPGEISACVAFSPAATSASYRGEGVKTGAGTSGLITSAVLGVPSGLPLGARLECDEVLVWPLKGTHAEVQAQARTWA